MVLLPERHLVMPGDISVFQMGVVPGSTGLWVRAMVAACRPATHTAPPKLAEQLATDVSTASGRKTGSGATV